MKYLFFSFFSFLTLSLPSQTDQLNKVDKLIENFAESNDVSLITEAQKILVKVFENESAMLDPMSLLTKAQVQTLALAHTEVDDPYKLCDGLENLYTSAFAHDIDMKLRPDILNSVYQSKRAMLDLGNKTYEEESFDKAYMYYTKAINMNNLEVAHPRVARKDYSILYTSAVFADLAGNKNESIRIFEELVEANFDRIDMYDTLIKYYEEQEKKTDVMRIKTLKAERYPN